MNELNNTVNAVGNYNSIPTSLTSNTSVVTMIEGLTLTKDADKKNWSSGNLTYKITLTNDTDNTYENPTITDIIDTTLITFVADSVTIGGIKASASEYSYDTDSHTLTVKLPSVIAKTSSIVTFQVKKRDGFLALKNYAIFRSNGLDKLLSNTLTVLSPISKRLIDNLSCKTPYWRI